MSNFRINFENPWLLLLLIPAAVMTLVLYLRLNKKYRRNRNRITSIVLHSLVMLMCISVLAGIHFSYEKRSKENEIIILVDVSDSNETAMEQKEQFIRDTIKESSSRFKMGIVTFGYNQVLAAPLSYETENLISKYKISELPDCSATDIASALLYARDTFTKTEMSKIVLLSDGVETDKKAINVIKALTAEGIMVDTVYFENVLPEKEVQIVNAERPDHTVTYGVPFEMSVSLKSSFQGAATIKLTDKTVFDTKVGESKGITLITGLNDEIKIEHTFDVPGVHELEFVVESAQDNCKLNNTYKTYFNIVNYDKLLIIERGNGEGATLESIISEDSENVKRIDITNIDELPKSVDEFRQYDQVVLANISNADMKEMPVGFIENLHSYVYDYGGGMLTVGGTKKDDQNNTVINTYDLDDMYTYDENAVKTETLYQQMLPVQSVAYTPPVAVMLLIDYSGSMDAIDEVTGKTRLELAKDGARSCINVLTERDYCGIITFSSNFSLQLDVTPLTKFSTISAAIDKIGSSGDGTVFEPAIERAGQLLATISNVERKHIILVTDGMPADPLSAYGAKIKNNFEKLNITMSIVGVDVGYSQAVEMQQAVGYGNGKFHNADTAADLPSLMRDDLLAEEIKGIKYGEDYKVEIATYNSVVNGIVQNDIKPITGYFGTKIKKDATVVLKTEFVPIYAQWNYGEGRVGSLMVDLKGASDSGGESWSDKFLSNQTGRTIVKNIVSGLFPMDNIQPQQIELEIDEDNYSNLMTVSLESELSKEKDKEEIIKVTIDGPAAEGETEKFHKEITADWTNYSRISFDLTVPGLYTILVERIDHTGKIVASNEIYKAFSYSKEYDLFYDKEECRNFLRDLAREGNGEVISTNDVTGVFDDFDDPIIIKYDPKFIFIIASIVLFLLDIAVRKFKFKWLHEIIRDRKAQKEIERKNNI